MEHELRVVKKEKKKEGSSKKRPPPVDEEEGGGELKSAKRLKERQRQHEEEEDSIDGAKRDKKKVKPSKKDKKKKTKKKAKKQKRQQREASSSSDSSSSSSSSDDSESEDGDSKGRAKAKKVSKKRERHRGDDASSSAALDQELRALLSAHTTMTSNGGKSRQPPSAATASARPPSPDSPSAILAPSPPLESPKQQHEQKKIKKKAAAIVTSGLLQPPPPPPVAKPISTFGSRGSNGLLISGIKKTPEEMARRRARAQRFADGGGAGASSGVVDDSVQASGGLVKVEPLEGDYWDAPAIQGTCKVVEKDYIRQLHRVDPSTVRPLPVLQEALARVKAHYRRHEDYDYAWNQLKSIRQDLMVQHINTPFTVHVYETHARIALEGGDLNEFNLCCSRLTELRESEGLPTSVAEFVAYRLLHALYKKHYQEIYSTLLRCGKEDPSVRASEPVEHALAVIRAEARHDFHSFFRLYVSAPHMSAYLMDFLVLRMRRLAVQSMFKAYRPTLRVSFITQELAFDDQDECRDFLVNTMGAIVIRQEPPPPPQASKHHRKSRDQQEEEEDGGSGPWVVDCKASHLAYTQRQQQQQQTG